MFLSTKIAALTASTLVFGGGVIGVTTLDKTVTLTVDGASRSVSGLASTVGDVLRNDGVQVGEQDLVSPEAATAVTDGTQITVAHSRPVTLAVDGRITRLATTAATVNDVLSEVDPAAFADARLSLPRETAIGLAGLSLSVSTPKQITLTLEGKKRSVTTDAPTVAALLADKGIAADGDDRLSHQPFVPLTAGMKVSFAKVSVKTTTVKESLAAPVTRKKDANLWLGESRIITAGTAGKAKVTYLVTTSLGESVKMELSRVTLSKPVAQVIAVGSKTTSSGIGLNLARASSWDAIARCESGGNWSINTGNGYYGGLQFNLASWNGNGGRDFAAYPHRASRAEQITVANRYYAKAGFRPWSCRHVL